MSAEWASLLGSAPTLPYDGIPKYQQIARQLRVGINRLQLEPETPLPSATQLASIYGVSRVVARKAYEVLERAELVTVQHGRQPYVRTLDGGPKPLQYRQVKAVNSAEFAALLEVFESIERHLHRIADTMDPQGEYKR